MSKNDTLRVRYSKRHKDMMYHYPTTAADGSLLHLAFSYAHHFTLGGLSLYKQLEARGYDLTTLKFSIKRKKL